jgi:HAD superfamily hydrolase (TIGR01509 family)
MRVQRGEAAELAGELVGDRGRPLIEPMPGYAAFIAAIKGWLGDEVAALRDELYAGRAARLRPSEPETPADHDAAAFDRLVACCKRFERQPAKLALVTASIGFEAHAVMNEVRARMADEVRQWRISGARRDRILAALADRERVFDALVTADDACEHRLKPHPDLYSLALVRMGIEPGDYGRCIGLEDTEPGVVAQRAAGIGCAVALPNRDTHRQNFQAAARIIEVGLPGLLLRHHLLAQSADERKN